MHRFFYLKHGQPRVKQFDEFFHIAPDAMIHDDIFRYQFDTLLWVPCYWLCMYARPRPQQKKAYGLFDYGTTYINTEGGKIFSQVMEAWADLLSLGPSEFELTGQIRLQPAKEYPEYIELTGHQRIEIKRDWVVENLRTLAEFGRQVEGTKDRILHVGI